MSDTCATIQCGNEAGQRWTVELDELALTALITQACLAVDTGDLSGLEQVLRISGLLGGVKA